MRYGCWEAPLAVKVMAGDMKRGLRKFIILEQLQAYFGEGICGESGRYKPKKKCEQM